MSKRIGVVGLTSNENIGDYLLVESAKFLLTKHSIDITVLDVDVDPRDESIYRGKRKLNLKLFELMTRYQKPAFFFLRFGIFRYYYQYFYWWIKLNWYYKATLKNLDGIVISGGGFLKFKTQGLNYNDELIIKIARKRNIPVMLSAVGIEGYDEKDIRCQRLKKTINSGVVRAITTRDDIETLRRDYITNQKIVTDQVGDPVFWLKDMLSINNKTKRPKSDKVGINLVNPNNFVRYGGKANKFTIENFYKNLLQELNMRDIDFYLFTNGMLVDQEFGERLVRSMNLPKETLLPRPLDSAEFVRIVSSFGIVLSGRMHAGIVSYALDVPVVGLIWGEKIDFFTKIVGIRNNYFNEDELDFMKIADLLTENNLEKPSIKKRDELKKKTLKYLGKFLDGISEKEKGQ